MNLEAIDIAAELSEIRERKSMEGIMWVMLSQAERIGGIKMPTDIREQLEIRFPNRTKIDY